MHPSAIWTAWMSSAFLIFPGFNPSVLAFIRISGIPIRFSAIFIVDILLTPLDFSSGSIHPLRFSRTTFTIKFFLPSISRADYPAALAKYSVNIFSIIYAGIHKKSLNFPYFSDFYALLVIFTSHIRPVRVFDLNSTLQILHSRHEKDF